MQLSLVTGETSRGRSGGGGTRLSLSAWSRIVLLLQPTTSTLMQTYPLDSIQSSSTQSSPIQSKPSKIELSLSAWSRIVLQPTYQPSANLSNLNQSSPIQKKLDETVLVRQVMHCLATHLNLSGPIKTKLDVTIFVLLLSYPLSNLYRCYPI